MSAHRNRAAPGVFTGLPSGLGDSAERTVAALARRAHAFPEPQSPPPVFAMPYPARPNPRQAAARARAAQWAELTGLTGPAGVWSRERFDRLELALFTALTQPDLPVEELLLVGDWNVWAFAVDDHFVTLKATGDAAGARRFVARLAACMPPAAAAAPGPRRRAGSPGPHHRTAGAPDPQDRTGPAEPQHPVEVALAGVWARSAAALPPDLRRRLRDAALDFAAANLWELDNTLAGRVSDPVEYLQMRRRTAGTPLSTVLPLHVRGRDLPPELLAHPTVTALIEAFADNVDLRNDLYSCRKETELEGELNNAVPVFRHFLRCSRQTAVDTVTDLMNARLDCFDRIAREDVPHLAEEFGPEAGRTVTAFTDGLKDWLAGDHAWYPRTGRYTVATG
ncbi:terpene synthase family protein [Kitasatospora sp. NPDC001574]